MLKKVKRVRVLLQNVSQEKDIGVTFDERPTVDLKQHTLENVNKTNQTKGLIRRYFSYLDIQNFRWQFNVMVFPHLEYVQSVWSLFGKDIVNIENVQRRTTKMLPGMKDLSYKERLKKSDLPPLVYR